MKIYKKVILVILFVIYMYIANISLIKNDISILEGEELDVKTMFGVDIESSNNYNSIPTVSKIVDNKEQNKQKYQIKLFDIFVVKEVNVTVIDSKEVIPLGNSIALKIYTKGVLVVGSTEIKGIDGKKYKPFQSLDIEEGDNIIEINGKTISSTDELIQNVNNSKGKEILIKYVKKNEEKTGKILPVQVEKNEYKLGLWVRDAAAGVGTATFYEPETSSFGALGHGISDIDTEELINISKGELVNSNIIYLKKGEKGNPGEMKGTVNSKEVLGDINLNTDFGIFGKIKNTSPLSLNYKNKMEVANRKEIKTGKAEILAQLNSDNIQKYEIEIKRIYLNNNKDNKSMLIKVTDSELIKKTGGIIQGMSGAPIIQNKKFVGAVTNVFINDPTQGYAVFGDLMLNNL